MKPTDIERTSPTKQMSLPLAGIEVSRTPRHVKSKTPKKGRTMPSEAPPEPIDMIERLKGVPGRKAPKSAASAESKLKIGKKPSRRG